MYTRIRIRKGQRGLRFRGGDFAEMLRPGRYWLRVGRYDASTVRLVSEDVDSILVAGARTGLVSEVSVGEGQELLVFRDGDLVDRLTTGRFVYWTGVGHVLFKLIDRREQVLDVAGQEIMTNDKVTLRVNLVVTYRVTDSVASVSVVSDSSQATQPATADPGASFMRRAPPCVTTTSEWTADYQTRVSVDSPHEAHDEHHTARLRRNHDLRL